MANADKIACERVPRIAAVLSFPGLRGQLTGSRRKSSATTGYPGRFAPGSAQAKAHPMGPPLPSDRPEEIRQVLQAGESIGRLGRIPGSPATLCRLQMKTFVATP